MHTKHTNNKFQLAMVFSIIGFFMPTRETQRPPIEPEVNEPIPLSERPRFDGLTQVVKPSIPQKKARV